MQPCPVCSTEPPTGGAVARLQSWWRRGNLRAGGHAAEAYRALCSALFVKIVSAHSSEVVGAAGTYQQEVDTLNLTFPPHPPLQIRASACCVYTLTAVAAFGFIINCRLQKLFNRRRCSRDVDQENGETFRFCESRSKGLLSETERSVQTSVERAHSRAVLSVFIQAG